MGGWLPYPPAPAPPMDAPMDARKWFACSCGCDMTVYRSRVLRSRDCDAVAAALGVCVVSDT